MINKLDASQTEETLSREHPISEFLRSQKDRLQDMSQEEFVEKYEAHFLKVDESKESMGDESVLKDASSRETLASSRARFRSKMISGSGTNLNKIVLKFTTVSDGCNEAPSFTVGPKGARIGRDMENEISVPSDLRLAPFAHATIEYIKGSFYVLDGGHDHAASVRIGVGLALKKQWFLEKNSKFSAGNSAFLCCGVDETGELVLQITEGPLKNEFRSVKKAGATFGRSSENLISIPDRELSRKHSRIEFDEKNAKYFLSDMGSTNGTYMQLVGPYEGRLKLSLNDHILVGRTGFSINRYDYGLSEEIGHRQTMEDACAIVQHMNIAPFNIPGMSPQSFFGVFDGHGGNQASHYLSQNLHVHVADGLLSVAADVLKAYDDSHELLTCPSPTGPSTKDVGGDLNSQRILSEAWKAIDDIVVEALKSTYVKTDNLFISTSPHAHHGSTATTAFILGNRLYCPNVGDSRVLLCRDFKAYPMTEDHKPSREDESKRIRDAGGFVINNRVMGELAVSRAFGDCEFKKGIQGIIDQDCESGGYQLREGAEIDKSWEQPLIIAEPDIQITSISEMDQFLLLGCDGLFDVFTPEDVVDFVRSNMLEHRDAQKCCQNLTYAAIRKRNSRDNVSVILIIINPWY